MKIPLFIRFLFAAILGIILGILPQTAGYSIYFRFLGDILLGLLTILIIPWILSSVIMGQIDLSSTSKLTRINIKLILYYILTTAIAVTLALLIVNILKPGVGADQTLQGIPEELSEIEHLSFNDLITIQIKNLIQNPFLASSQQNILTLFFLSLIFGIALTKIAGQARVIIEVFDGTQAALKIIIDWLMEFVPLGIFGLIYYITAFYGPQIIYDIGRYVFTVFLTLIIYTCLILPLFIIIFAKINPFRFFMAMKELIILSISTGDNILTLPIAMKSMEKLKVSEHIINVTMPLGVIFSLSGSALTQAISVLFITQAYGIHIDLQLQLIICLIITLANFLTIALPYANWIIISLILHFLGLQLYGIGLVFAIEPFLKLGYNTTNILNNAMACLIIGHSEKAITKEVI